MSNNTNTNTSSTDSYILYAMFGIQIINLIFGCITPIMIAYGQFISRINTVQMPGGFKVTTNQPVESIKTQLNQEQTDKISKLL